MSSQALTDALSLSLSAAQRVVLLQTPQCEEELKLLSDSLTLSLSLQKEEEQEPWLFRAQKPPTSPLHPIQLSTSFPTQTPITPTGPCHSL